jgi:hypothetical protein
LSHRSNRLYFDAPVLRAAHHRAAGVPELGDLDDDRALEGGRGVVAERFGHAALGAILQNSISAENFLDVVFIIKFWTYFHPKTAFVNLSAYYIWTTSLDFKVF